MNYYYFAAALPALSFDEAPILSSEAFLALCHEHLTPGDLRDLDRLIAGTATDARHRFVHDWCRADRRLRNELVRTRAARLDRDPEPWLRDDDGIDPTTHRAVGEAMTKQNPLERERALDRFRWSQIEEHAGYNPFSIEALYAYALKLKLTERWAAMDATEGERRLANAMTESPKT